MNWKKNKKKKVNLKYKLENKKKIMKIKLEN